MTEYFSINTYKKATPEALQKLASLISEINDKIAVAEEYAKTNGLEFECDFGYGGRATYGLYGTYAADDMGIQYSPEDVIVNEDDEESVYYWYTSTMSCM